MFDPGWSASEKKIARSVHVRAVESILEKLMAEFKAMAAAAATPSDIWAVQDHLREQRQVLDDLSDYRYSRLRLILVRLIRKGYLGEARLGGCRKRSWRTFVISSRDNPSPCVCSCVTAMIESAQCQRARACRFAGGFDGERRHSNREAER
ncbi:MAG: hypothetical protein IT563_23400 [Alphaproteobacteria bacterium]|nr:hypothetical protein [Alphaproteobacteria bacterium]